MPDPFRASHGLHPSPASLDRTLHLPLGSLHLEGCLPLLPSHPKASLLLWNSPWLSQAVGMLPLSKPQRTIRCPLHGGHCAVGCVSRSRTVPSPGLLLQ